MLSKPFHEEINRSKRPCGPHKTASRAKCGPRATGWAALLYGNQKYIAYCITLSSLKMGRNAGLPVKIQL